MITRPDISRIIIMGDSLSDRGTIYKKKLFGFTPMSLLAGLAGTAPGDSFTNGMPWSDHFIAALANEFTIKKFQNDKKWRSDDMADAIVNNDIHVRRAIEYYFNLRDDKKVDYRDNEFVRCYTEGGLTSHSYKWVPSINIKRFFTRLILSTLREKRADLLAHDEEHANVLPPKEKAKTLIIEWSGANDLITVNERPSMTEVNKAVAERIRNIETLVAHGYRHFFLMNLPDLSLTPRFQAKDKYERENARACSAYFNRRLMAACAGLQKQYPDCTIEAVDVNREFTEMFNHPEKYQMDKSKLSQPYTKSGDFRILKNGTSPATGYMFWDDVHPTADVHAMLAYIFCERYRNRFHFMDPAVAEQKRKSQMGRQVRVLERTHSCDRLRLNQFGVLCHTHRNDRQHAPSSHELRRQSAQSRIQPSDCHDETVDNPANKSRC